MLAPDTLIAGRYRIVRKIGKGGMGTIYEAVDERLDEKVALKQTLVTDDALKRAFEREARLLAKLRHPNLPRVTDQFIDEPGQFFVMDYIHGKDLAEILSERGIPFEVKMVLRWADQLLDVLDYLHNHNPPIIHRDIKPQNAKVTMGGRLMLLDFGLAKGSSLQTKASGGSSVRAYTPDYAPLEQIQGSGTDAQSDIYSLGATLYTLLTNKIPINALTRSLSHINQEPDPQPAAHTLNPQVPLAISAVVMQAMALPAKERPASAAAMRAQLQAAASQGVATGPTVMLSLPPAEPAPPPPAPDNRIVPDNADQVVELARLTGHSKGVRSVAFAPDGQTLASASGDKTVRLWHVADGAPLRSLTGHTNWVSSVAFAPDGQTLASASWDHTVRLWRVASGTLLRTLAGHTNAVNTVAFAPDGQTLASASRDQTVRLWNVADGALLRILTGHTNWVNSVDFAPDGQTLASASGDKTVGLWHVADGALLRTLTGHANYVTSVTFAPDGQTLASASWDHTVRLWRVASGTLLRTLAGNADYVTSVAFAPDGQTLASASRDQTVRLWRVADGALLCTLDDHTGWVHSVAFSPDGRLLASASNDGTVRLWGVAPE